MKEFFRYQSCYNLFIGKKYNATILSFEKRSLIGPFSVFLALLYNSKDTDFSLKLCFCLFVQRNLLLLFNVVNF